MDLFKANIFRAGFFKQAKYLAATPERAERVIYISETGVLSMESLPMSTGYMTAEKEHMTWAVIHSLKFKLTKFGESIQDARAMLICERSYVPLDPLNKIKAKEKEKLASLNDIAKNRHAIERANVAAGNVPGRAPLTEVVTYGSIVIVVICIIASLIG